MFSLRLWERLKQEKDQAWRIWEREAVRIRNERAAQEFWARPGYLVYLTTISPLALGAAAQRVYAQQPISMDEDEIAHYAVRTISTVGQRKKI
jgi:hypothetical protein